MTAIGLINPCNLGLLIIGLSVGKSFLWWIFGIVKIKHIAGTHRIKIKRTTAGITDLDYGSELRIFWG